MKKAVLGTTLALLVVLAVAGGTALASPPDPNAQMQEYCHGGGAGYGLDGLSLERVAELTGLTPEEIIAQREAGTSFFAIAQTKGVGQQNLINTVLEPQREMLQFMVKYGRLTQVQADAILAASAERLQTVLSATDTTTGGYGYGGMMNSSGVGGMMGGQGGMMGGRGGMMGGYAAPYATPGASSNNRQSGFFGGMMNGIGQGVRGMMRGFSL